MKDGHCRENTWRDTDARDLSKIQDYFQVLNAGISGLIQGYSQCNGIPNYPNVEQGFNTKDLFLMHCEVDMVGHKLFNGFIITQSEWQSLTTAALGALSSEDMEESCREELTNSSTGICRRVGEGLAS